MGLYSPFGNAFDCKSYPNSRTIRTSLSQKIIDSFEFWAGRGQDSQTQIGHLGVLDYLLLFLPALANLFLELSGNIVTKQDPKLGKGLYILTLIISLPVLVLHYGLAAILTVLFLPVVTLTHVIANFAKRHDYQAILTLKGKAGENSETLSEFLNHEKVTDLDNLKLHFDMGEKKIRFSTQTNKELSTQENTELSTQATKEFVVNMDLSNYEQKKQVSSLLKFNLFRSTEKIETRPDCYPELAELLPKGKL